jgi:hypothetical protein
VREVVIGILLCILTPVVSYTQIYTQSTTGTEQTENTENTEGAIIPEIKEPRKSFIKGLRGIDSLSIKKVTLGSMIVPGYAQAYNRQYWKIPVIYGTGAAFIYGGAHSKSLYKKTGDAKYKTQSNFYYAGAGLVYLGSLIEGIASYKTYRKEIVPVKSTLFSTFLPGLGQAYNGDYYKIPIIYGGFAFTAYWFSLNKMQYTRFRNAYNTEVAYNKGETDTPSEFNGRLSETSLKNYRDHFRRDRDYAVLWIALVYAVNVVDATVWAHLSSFDVGEDLAFKLSPALISPSSLYAQKNNMPAIGLNLSISLK